jgi:hypothetical protein
VALAALGPCACTALLGAEPPVEQAPTEESGAPGEDGSGPVDAPPDHDATDGDETEGNSGGGSPSEGAPPPPLPPVIRITSPAEGDTVSVRPPEDIVMVAFTTNVMLGPPGSCPASYDLCGLVVVRVDGDACDFDGGAYDNAGWGSPIDAFVASCPTPAGAHTITLEVHHSDWSLTLDPQGQPVTASVHVTTTGGS